MRALHYYYDDVVYVVKESLHKLCRFSECDPLTLIMWKRMHRLFENETSPLRFLLLFVVFFFVFAELQSYSKFFQFCGSPLSLYNNYT